MVKVVVPYTEFNRQLLPGLELRGQNRFVKHLNILLLFKKTNKILQ